MPIFVANLLLLTSILLLATHFFYTGEFMLHRDTSRYIGVHADTETCHKKKHYEQQHPCTKNLSALWG